MALQGTSEDYLRPEADREFIFYFIADIMAFCNMVYMVATVSELFVAANKKQRENALRVDTYLDMLKRLRLPQSMRLRIHEFWDDYDSVEKISSSTHLLKDLPPQLRAFITVSVFVPMLERIPFIEPFLM